MTLKFVKWPLAITALVIFIGAHAQSRFGGDVTEYVFDVDGLEGSSRGPSGANIKVRFRHGWISFRPLCA